MSIFKNLDHVAIGVEDIEKARRFFCDVLGAEAVRPEKTSQQEAFTFQKFELGGAYIELVTPVVKGEGGVGRYLKKHGEGLHHISVTVEDAQEALKYFESKGIRILGTGPDKSRWRHYYLHPKDTFGALIQISERWGRKQQDAHSKSQ